MLVFSREEAWIERLRRLAARGGWPFETRSVLPARGRPTPGLSLIVLDSSVAGSGTARAVAALRALYPTAAVALACGEDELGSDAVAAAVSSGADETIVKSWPDARLSSRLSVLRDAALAAEIRLSADEGLKVERRSHRAFVKVRGRWTALALAALDLELLWCLLEREGDAVSRGELLTALEAARGRAVEVETVSRRVLALRRTLAPWKGKLESVRGGFYRLFSSPRRSTT